MKLKINPIQKFLGCLNYVSKFIHNLYYELIAKNYSTTKKEILSIVLNIAKFLDDLFNKKFLLQIDCKVAKDVLQKAVKNLVSKQIFAQWQGLLLAFDFDIQFIKGDQNFIPDFRTREFLQGNGSKTSN